MLRATSGVSSIEFALTAPLMLILLMPVVDLGMGFYQQMQVSDAAEAGAQYALVHGFGSVTAIQTAVTNATTLAGISAAPAPVEQCGCPNATNTAVTLSTSPLPPNCSTSNCASTGRPMGTYVTVSAQSGYTPILRYSVFGSSRTLSAASVVRLQ